MYSTYARACSEQYIHKWTQTILYHRVNITVFMAPFYILTSYVLEQCAIKESIIAGTLGHRSMFVLILLECVCHFCYSF